MVKLSWPLDFEIVTEPGELSVRPVRHSAQTIGISIGGAFIETHLRPSVGTSLRLWLRPPNAPAEVLRLQAEVRWLSDGGRPPFPSGFGVAFRALTALDEFALHGYFSASLKMI